MANTPLAYTIEEAVRVTGIGKTSLYKAIKEERIKARKWGTRTLIPHDQLECLINELPTKA